MAKAFAGAAKKLGIEVVGEQSWDAKQPNYTALYQAVKASGADLVYLGGIYDNNGGQLIKDKVAVLGDNDGDVKLVAPDGFYGYPDMLKLPESAGMYLTFAGAPPGGAGKAGGAGAKLLEAYKDKYGKDPRGWLPDVRGRGDAGDPGGHREVRRHPQGRHRGGAERRRHHRPGRLSRSPARRSRSIPPPATSPHTTQCPDRQGRQGDLRQDSVGRDGQ